MAKQPENAYLRAFPGFQHRSKQQLHFDIFDA